MKLDTTYIPGVGAIDRGTGYRVEKLPLADPANKPVARKNRRQREVDAQRERESQRTEKTDNKCNF